MPFFAVYNGSRGVGIFCWIGPRYSAVMRKTLRRRAVKFGARLRCLQFCMVAPSPTIQISTHSRNPRRVMPGELCTAGLEMVEQHLRNIQSLVSRHRNPSCSATPPGPGELNLDGAKNKSSRKERFSTHLKRSTHSISWIAADKETLKNLIERLRELNDGLSTFITEPQRQGIEKQSIWKGFASNDSLDLDEIVQVASGINAAQAQGATFKALMVYAINQVQPQDIYSIPGLRFGFWALDAGRKSYKWHLDTMCNEVVCKYYHRLRICIVSTNKKLI